MKNTRWLTILLLGSAEAALAQASSRPPSIGAAPRASGTVSRQIGVRAAVDLSYESNVYGVSNLLAEQQALRGRSRDDFQLSPSLQLNIVLPYGGRQSAFLQGQIGYDFNLRNENLNRERIGLTGGTNLSLGGCSSTVSGTFNRSRINAGDLFVASPGAVNLRNRAQTNVSYGAQVRCGGAIGLTPSLGYRRSTVRSGSGLLAFNNTNTDTIDASLGYQRPSLGRISVFGVYTEAEYLGRDVNFNFSSLGGAPNPLFNPNALDGVKSYVVGVRFERDIGSRLYGAVSVGYNWVNPRSPLASDFNGSNYSVSLSVRPTDRLSVDLLADRSSNVSNNLISTFTVTETYSLNGTYAFNDRLRATFGSSLQKRDFGLAATVDRTAFLTNDEFIRAYVGAAYDLNRRLRLNALVSQQRRKSDNALFNFNNTSVSLGASLALGR